MLYNDAYVSTQASASKLCYVETLVKEDDIPLKNKNVKRVK